VQRTTPKAQLERSRAPEFLHLRDFRNIHAGQTIVVCGCGSSLRNFERRGAGIVIGVNDVGRLLDPDYLVVLNPRTQFVGDRFHYVEQSRARVVFSQLVLGISHPRQVRFRLGRKNGTEISGSDALPYTGNSPYLAACLAAYMGARRIGLIGVDFTDHHFFAETGTHPLSRKLAEIDNEFGALFQSLRARGVELLNLSSQSRLTRIPKMSLEAFAAPAAIPESVLPQQSPLPARSLVGKIFFVGYRFLSCGSVFEDGLAHAADELALRSESAYWDDPRLHEKVAAFHPDLLFVVHGRNFSKSCRSLARRYPSAVWLLDEPYEVDDTARFSSLFDTVFVNDPASIHRHPNAHYLPVCFDPAVYRFSPAAPRSYAAGFIGGANQWREQALARLAAEGLLSYVVGGPWREPALKRICRFANIEARETANLYRDTRIVVNLFRTKHHFNSKGIAAVSLNPRVYEAVACGALVISEYRPELDSLFPEMPAFRSQDELVALVRRYLNDEQLLAETRDACVRRLAGHTYADRLKCVLALSAAVPEDTLPQQTLHETSRPFARSLPEIPEEWEPHPECVHTAEDGALVLSFRESENTGIERGLVGTRHYGDVVLEFDLNLDGNSRFIAKLRQQDAQDQLTNSYHLMCSGAHAYVARHEHVLRRLRTPLSRWANVKFSCRADIIELWLDGVRQAFIRDQSLKAGYCFLGVKGGSARIRNIRVAEPEITGSIEHECEVLRGRTGPTPAVSIITTVYDRVECLEQCIRSVGMLRYRDYEQIVVCDAPHPDILHRIEEIVRLHDPGAERITLANLKSRRNDWGITPAAAGLSLASGKYGYLEGHFDPLVAMLDQDPSVGFAYSSCLYAGRTVLNSSVPRLGRIDLGQPLFRRELFDLYLDGRIPFHEFGWDWRMIEHFVKSGVRWRHLNQATFIFRLARYPRLITHGAVRQIA
jgi:hypothetical protein